MRPVIYGIEVLYKIVHYFTPTKEDNARLPPPGKLNFDSCCAANSKNCFPDVVIYYNQEELQNKQRYHCREWQIS